MGNMSGIREDPSLHDTTSHWVHGNSDSLNWLPLFLAGTNSPS
jgi:hypothetical protein